MQRPQVDDIPEENVGQNIEGILQDDVIQEHPQGGGQQQQENNSQDLEHLLEEVHDGEFDPDLQEVLEIQHQAGVGEGQLSTQQFEKRFFIQ